MTHAERLDKASSVFFFIGFVASKLQLVPFFFVSSLFNGISLGLYLVGYLLWLLASQMYPDHSPCPEAWYGFTQFKNQHKAAAILGVIAIVCCGLSLLFPGLFIPALWLFAVSNCIWCLAEYHKLMHPPCYQKNYSSAQQKIYFRYALVSTSISIISATATTLSVLLPPVGLLALGFSALVGLYLTTVAFNYWLNSAFYDPNEEKVNKSYITVSSKLENQQSGLKKAPIERAIEQKPESFSTIFKNNTKESANLDNFKDVGSIGDTLEPQFLPTTALQS